MGVRIWTGDAIVLASGAVTSFFGGPLWFEVDLPSGRALSLRVHFVTENGPPRVELRIAPDAVDLILADFDVVAGKGSAEPVLIDESDEGRVHLHFRVFRYGQSVDREFQFTFFLSNPSTLSTLERTDVR